MKLRILNDSIRLRFSQSELTMLYETGKVSGVVHFPSAQQFVYSLIRSDDRDALYAEWADSGIQVFIPKKSVEELATTELVGIDNTIALEEGSLKILVEKDFKCLTERAEDESDLFKKPLEDKINC